MAMSKERLTEIKASPIIDWAEVTELIAEVERLTAVVFPSPEQLTEMEGQARDTLEKTQSSIVMTALAEHFLTVGSALREHDARLIAADERLAACEAAHEQAMVVADHLAEVARRVTDELDDLAAQNAKTESNFEEFAEAVVADRRRAEEVHAAEVAAMREELAAVREALAQVGADLTTETGRAASWQAAAEASAAAVQRAAEHARHWTGWGSRDYAQAGYQILADLGQPAAAAPDDEQDGAYR